MNSFKIFVFVTWCAVASNLVTMTFNYYKYGKFSTRLMPATLEVHNNLKKCVEIRKDGEYCAFTAVAIVSVNEN